MTPVRPETITIKSEVDLIGADGHACLLTGALATNASAFPFVVISADAKGEAGSPAPVAIAVGGSAQVKLGGTVTKGAKLTSDGAGKWVAASSNNDHYGAIALNDGDADDVIAALVRQGQVGA